MWTDTDIKAMRQALLRWYDEEGRRLPWRVRPEDRAKGMRPDPYAVWLSEIMLQQTTVPHGTPYWFKFLEIYPRVEDLADAPLDDVNILRFVETLKEMAEETQFLIVTHNKLTMEVASTLYGVTMEERGASKLVAVEMEQVQPVIEQAATA